MAKPWLQAPITMVCGFLLAYLAYFAGPPTGLNRYEVLGSLLFWYGTTYLVFRFPLKQTFRLFATHIRSGVGLAACTLYVAFHLFLYGFILEYIFVRLYAPNIGTVGAAAWINTNLVLPPTPTNTLLGLTYNPSITISVPPFFGAALSLYSVSSAAILAALVVANIGLVRRLDRCGLGLRSRTYVVLPALGVAFGASCCLSPPVLLAIVEPAAAAVTGSLAAYYFTYFVFPPLAMVALYLNQRSLQRLLLVSEKRTQKSVGAT